jgi:hypothetical protein
MRRKIRRFIKKARRWFYENIEGAFAVAVIVGLFISTYAIAISLTLWLT